MLWAESIRQCTCASLKTFVTCIGQMANENFLFFISIHSSVLLILDRPFDVAFFN